MELVEKLFAAAELEQAPEHVLLLSVVGVAVGYSVATMASRRD